MAAGSAKPTADYPVEVDRTSPIPLYFQVAVRLQQLIESGEIAAGTRIENEIDLGERLGVSRPTTRHAIQYLVERGMLVRRRGVGTRVVNPAARRPVELSSLYDDLVAAGRSPRTVIRTFEILPATNLVAHALGLPEAAEVTWFERLRYAGEEPLALMQNAVPVSIFRPRREDLERGGLYEMLRRAGRTPRVATHVIGARSATSTEAQELGEKRGAALLTMSRTAWDSNGLALVYGSHLCRASVYSFEMTLTSG